MSEYRISLRRTLLLLSFLDVLPFHFRKLFDQLLQFLVISHSLLDALLPVARDVKLTEFATPALHEIERNVRLSLGAATSSFAALTATDCQCSPQETPEMNHLSGAGAKTAFWRLHGDSAHGLFSSGITMLYQIETHVNANN